LELLLVKAMLAIIFIVEFLAAFVAAQLVLNACVIAQVLRRLDVRLAQLLELLVLDLREVAVVPEGVIEALILDDVLKMDRVLLVQTHRLFALHAPSARDYRDGA
jgi:hypothetical protein